MASQKEKDILLNIIDMYKDMPFLWNKNHADYKNKSARYDGYRVLLEMYKNFDPDATLKTLKKKIENMKTTFMREAKKVTASKHTGAGTEDIHVPSLWYFEAFSFLGSTTEPCRPIKDSIENENSSSSDGEISQSGSASTSSVPAKKKKKSYLQKQEDLLDTAQTLISMKEEQWEVLGKSIGFQLRDLNKKELTIAQKLIGDVIYYAKIGRLTEDSYIAMATSFPSPAPSSFYTSSSNSTSWHQNNKRNSFSYPSPQYNIQISDPLPQHRGQAPQASPQYSIQTSDPLPQHRVQTPQASPQYSVQTSDPLPQHRAQTPQASPQYSIQTSDPLPQHRDQAPQPSPQYSIQTSDPLPQHRGQAPQPSPQYSVQTSDPLPQHRDQTPQSPAPYKIAMFDPPQIQIPDPLQYQLQSSSQQGPWLQPSSEAHSLQQNAPTATTTRININEFLIIKPKK